MIKAVELTHYRRAGNRLLLTNSSWRRNYFILSVARVGRRFLSVHAISRSVWGLLAGRPPFARIIYVVITSRGFVHDVAVSIPVSVDVAAIGVCECHLVDCSDVRPKSLVLCKTRSRFITIVFRVVYCVCCTLRRLRSHEPLCLTYPNAPTGVEVSSHNHWLLGVSVPVGLPLVAVWSSPYTAGCTTDLCLCLLVFSPGWRGVIAVFICYVRTRYWLFNSYEFISSHLFIFHIVL